MDDAERILGQLREEPWTPFPDAVDLLTRLPPEAAPALRAALTDPNARIRAMAARALGAFCEPETVAALIYVLEHDLAPDVRRVAVAALRASAALGLLSDLLWSDEPNPWLLGETALALGELGDPAAFDALADALEHPNADVRGKAATALGLLGDPRGVAVLQDTLGNPTETDYVKSLAAEALAHLRGAR
jgi:HEAT repeat protein